MLKIPTSFTKVSQVLDTACTAQMLCLQFVPLTSASSILPGSLHPGKSVSLPSRIFALVTPSVEKGLLQDTLLNDVDDLTCKAEIGTWRESRCNSRKTTWFQRLHRMRPYGLQPTRVMVLIRLIVVISS